MVFSLKHDFQCIIERPLLKFGPFQHKELNWKKKNTWMPLWFILICNFKAAKLKNCNKSETFLRNFGGKDLFSGPTSSFRLGLQNFSVQSTLCPIYIFYAFTSVQNVWRDLSHIPAQVCLPFHSVNTLPKSEHSSTLLQCEHTSTLPQCEHSVNAQKTNLVQ